MKHLATILVALSLMVTSDALAVPSTVSFTGRLSTSAGPVNGNVEVTFSLFSTATGGSSVWTETRSGINATNGLFFVDLGAVTPLDDTIFDGAALYLEMTVSGETLSPRVPVRSVPYAIRANTADSLGPLSPTDVLTDVTASGGITAARIGTVVHLTGTPVSGSSPIAVTTGNVSLTVCGAGQIYKVVGGVWACAADDSGGNYTAVSNGGVLINGSNQIGLISTCAAGQVLKAGSTAGTWACGNDLGATYTAVPNGGVLINGSNQIGLISTCSAGQVLKAGASPGTWACANDTDTDTTYGVVAGQGVAMTGNDFRLESCPAGQVLRSTGSGNWACSSAVTISTQFSCIRTSASGGGTTQCAMPGTWNMCMLTRTYGVDSDDIDGFGCTISGSGSAWTLSAFAEDFSSVQCEARCISL
jgi:hypothetical protein